MSLQSESRLTEDEALQTREELRKALEEIERVIVGKRSVLELMMTAFLARGHVLIEDIPGVGKTTLAKALAHVVGGTFKRIQFTPDLLPGDVTGLTLWNQKTAEWVFSPGPVFTNVLLADEINRATPKTQSALLESMEEAQVTIDGVTHPLPQPFFVIATQNPIEYRGTYALPEAQMDRFLLRVRLGYPEVAQEIDLLTRHAEADSTAGYTEETTDTSANGAANGSAGSAGAGNANLLLQRVQEVWTLARARRLQALRARVYIAPPVQQYIVALTSATRSRPGVLLGASPRASVALQRAAQGAALLAGRPFVTPDEVKRLVVPVLGHRLMLQSGGNSQSAETLLTQILDDITVP
jgi:MoxR-like ATPase